MNPARFAVFSTLALVFCFGVAPALGQFRLLNTSPVFSEGQQGNLFVEWEGPEMLAGGSLTLPPGWRLVDAALVHHGHRQGVSWSSDAGESVYTLTPADPAAAPLRLVLKLNAPHYRAPGRWNLTPQLVDDSDEPAETQTSLALSDELITEPTRIDESNLVAVFDGRTRVELRGRTLPVYTGDRSYTVEFWFRTTGLGEVLLSSWDGDEESAYPIELVVAPDGRMQYFRGEPGRHVSMSTHRPVADGRWHHLAVVHDEVRGWTRMMVDGAPTDSLFGQTHEAIRASQRRLCLGGRCVAEPSSGPRRSVGYSGRLDDLRLWPTARTVRQIAASMGDEIPQVAGLITIGFDKSTSPDLVVTGDEITLEPSDFLFYDPVQNLSASMDGDDVVLEWESLGRNTVSFVVERSLDGVEFNEIGKEDPEGRANSYTYTDHDAPGGVIYYRVRQVLANGGSRSSGTLKVGIGEELPSVLSSVLVGNFPNPFSGQTTIRFEVFEPERVVVSVWDLSGHQVALLADELASPGVHEVPFVAGDLPSGMYFVRLQTDQGISTRTLTLTR